MHCSYGIIITVNKLISIYREILESEGGSMTLRNACDNWSHQGKLAHMGITLIIVYLRMK